MNKDPLVSAISGLLIPKLRAQSLVWLEENLVLGADAVASLSENLVAPKYNHRGMSRHIVAAKFLIDEFCESNRFCVLSTNKVLQQIPKQLHLAVEKLREDRSVGKLIAEKSVLDFGAGRFNTLNNSVLLYANGATEMFALEPASVDWAVALASIEQLVARMIFEPERFALPGTSAENIRKRLIRLNFPKLRKLADGDPSSFLLGPIKYLKSIDEIDSHSIDLSFSTSVFEHVIPFEEEMKKVDRVCKHDAVGIHTVDFTAHGKTKKDYNPIEVLYEASVPGLNRKRPSEITGLFEELGYSVSEVGVRNAEPGAFDRGRLDDHFKGFEDDDLLRLQSTFVISRR